MSELSADLPIVWRSLEGAAVSRPVVPSYFRIVEPGKVAREWLPIAQPNLERRRARLLELLQGDG